jgi:metallo-beta-lactamase family protein
VVRDAAARGGALIVPAFAVGRVQELIWTLRRLEDDGRIPSLPVFLDSPMAIDVTQIYCRHPEDHDIDMKILMDAGRCPLCSRQYQLVRTILESKALNARRGAMIIIAGSGMLTGGRVLQHLKQRIGDERTTVLLPGFQAEGTRGRALLEGARELRIHGRWVPVRARVVALDGLSAHADREEIFRWLAGFHRPPTRVYVVHGEPAASESLATGIRSRLGWPVEVPRPGQTVDL